MFQKLRVFAYLCFHFISSRVSSYTKGRICATKVSCRQAKFVIQGGYKDKKYQCREFPPKPFPREIWVQIIEEHLGRSDWLSLSRTCWFFQQITQAALYKTVTITPYHKAGFVTSFCQFTRSLRRRPGLGSFVSDLRLSALDNHKRTTHPIYSFSSRLDLFPNLECLTLDNFFIDAQLCSTLHSHPHLRTLILRSCKVDRSLKDAAFQHYTGSRITEIHIMFPDRDTQAEAWISVAPRALQVLKIITIINQHNLGQMLSAAKVVGGTLTTLDIAGVSGNIVPLLASSPQMRCLRIKLGGFDHNDYDLFSLLPSDSIPSLESYTGPAMFSRSLVQNRPVRVVGLGFDPDDNVTEVITSLARSSASITDLEVFGEIDMNICLKYAPTTIRRLALDYGTDKATLVQMLPALSLLVDLHTLDVFLGLHDESSIHEEVEQIAAACPSLRRLNNWRERWDLLKENVWNVSRFVDDQ